MNALLSYPIALSNEGLAVEPVRYGTSESTTTASGLQEIGVDPAAEIRAIAEQRFDEMPAGESAKALKALRAIVASHSKPQKP